MNELAQLFSVTAGSPEPIYRQLVGQVHRRVATGQWPAGTEMPSVRELAQALALNPMTVSKAFSILEAEGVLTRRRGLSMVVADRPNQPLHQVTTTLLQPTMLQAITEAKQAGLQQSEAMALFKALWQQNDRERKNDPS